MMNKAIKKIGKKSSRYLLLFVLSILWIIPIATIVITSTKSRADFFSGISLFELPETIYWGNFIEAFQSDLLMYMGNSFYISIIKVPLGILVSAMAAFALTRLEIKGKKLTFIYFLIGMMVPVQIILVPINTFFSNHNLIDSYMGLIYVYIALGLPFAILVLRGFFISIPKEIDEAAYIDGCSKLRLFFSIILPLAKPALASLFIIDFLGTWNEFLIANILIRNNSLRPATAGLMAFMGEHGTDFGLLSAGVLFNVIPLLIVYIVFQRYFVEGVAGAVK